MEPVLAYVVVAGRFIRDTETSKVTLVDIFDAFSIPKDLKESTQSFITAARILNVKAAGLAMVEIKVEHPTNGTFVAVAKMSGPLKDGDLDVFSQFVFPISDEGRYYVRVFLNGEKLEDRNLYYINAVRLA